MNQRKSTNYLFIILLIFFDYVAAHAGAEHYIFPLPTKSMTPVEHMSTMKCPKIKTTYNWEAYLGNWDLGSLDSADAYICASEKPVDMRTYKYLATLVFNQEVCKNKCTYGIPADDEELKKKCGLTESNKGTDISGIPCLLPKWSGFNTCDIALTMQYITLCEKFGGEMLGICGYRTKGPSFLLDLASFFKGTSYVNASQDASKAMKDLAAAIKRESANSSSGSSSGTSLADLKTDYQRREARLNDNFTLMDPQDHACFPIQLAPMPPPFCDWEKVLSVKEGEQPQETSKPESVGWPPVVTFCGARGAETPNIKNTDKKLEVCMSVKIPKKDDKQADVENILCRVVNNQKKCLKLNFNQDITCQINKVGADLDSASYSGYCEDDEKRVYLSEFDQVAPNDRSKVLHALDVERFQCIGSDSRADKNGTTLISKNDYEIQYRRKKACLTGYPVPSLDKIEGITKVRIGNKQYPDCEVDSNDRVVGFGCVPCDLRACVDYYDFKFDCETALKNATDDDKKKGYKVDLCRAEIKDFCLSFKDSNKREYKNYDVCFNARETCNKASAVDVAFDPDKKKWPCRLVKEVFGDGK